MNHLNQLRQKAEKTLCDFPWTTYFFGWDILSQITALLNKVIGSPPKHLALITNLHQRDLETYQRLLLYLKKSIPKISGPWPAARPNTPQEDVLRLADILRKQAPEAVLIVSGGSGIDGVKAALVLAALGGKVEDYLGQGRVSQVLSRQKIALPPLFALQTAAGSAAHLTKYANITNWSSKQKKLIIDKAIIPRGALFDYSLTTSAPPSLTLDGALDGLSHCLEVYIGASGNPEFPRLEEICLLGIELILLALPPALKNPTDEITRSSLGLATDLGGYAIMLGGTSAGHLSSFALVDILPHGRACGLLNPYFLIPFSSAISWQLSKIAELLAKHQLISDISTRGDSKVEPASLAFTVVQGLQNFYRRVGFPRSLQEIPGYTSAHLERLLQMITNPQLHSKLQNMPLPLTPEQAQQLFTDVFQAAEQGDPGRLKPI